MSLASFQVEAFFAGPQEIALQQAEMAHLLLLDMGAAFTGKAQNWGQSHGRLEVSGPLGLVVVKDMGGH